MKKKIIIIVAKIGLIANLKIENLKLIVLIIIYTKYKRSYMA